MRNLIRLVVFLVTAGAGVTVSVQTATPDAAPLDVVIVHGHIIDGTGSPWYSGDISIRAGRIAAIGNLKTRLTCSATS
ncbi:hypothetical protein [Acidicapsa acidisoli]|uniref:hypothetical protein n=1 Tax=Acidicapsa acidisoli TaxID=1615681 RepID=UPI0021E0CF56|nr:hypothetical protein [Acidicapsa acidisoli]